MPNHFPLQSAASTTASAYDLALAIAKAADDRKGGDIVLLNVSEVSYLADYFVVVTGFSHAQVRAIARSIEDEIEAEFGRLPAQTEGQAEGNWLLLDYGDVIVHIFMPEEREFYSLEAFWGHAERTSFAATQLVNG
ncbi:ribosome silencing factor [Microcoleus sp. FACHB-1515]|uniref:ribosome silencing factor n=1 Tax=Cyanophyceae TaxID=3028117 RepID=UPI00168697F6|nr:ribosome silencing factor [Microcoleus sp. FACHB-1515]MBD2091258.1 ribosome silencing factor [Microcoleus sp. FACHB-1515]